MQRTRRDDRFLVVFSSGSAAVEAWRFGEDELAARMLDIDDDRMLDLWRTAAEFYDENHPLPVTGRRITLGHVIVFACLYHVGGGVRPLARQRRRPANQIPDHLLNARTAKDDELTALNLRLTADQRSGRSHPRRALDAMLRRAR